VTGAVSYASEISSGALGNLQSASACGQGTVSNITRLCRSGSAATSTSSGRLCTYVHLVYSAPEQKTRRCPSTTCDDLASQTPTWRAGSTCVATMARQTTANATPILHPNSPRESGGRSCAPAPVRAIVIAIAKTARLRRSHSECWCGMRHTPRRIGHPQCRGPAPVSRRLVRTRRSARPPGRRQLRSSRSLPSFASAARLKAPGGL
jgi:hypothetical protein